VVWGGGVGWGGGGGWAWRILREQALAVRKGQRHSGCGLRGYCGASEKRVDLNGVESSREQKSQFGVDKGGKGGFEKERKVPIARVRGRKKGARRKNRVPCPRVMVVDRPGDVPAEKGGGETGKSWEDTQYGERRGEWGESLSTQQGGMVWRSAEGLFLEEEKSIGIRNSEVGKRGGM